jgi:uncharacterized membrane protein
MLAFRYTFYVFRRIFGVIFGLWGAFLLLNKDSNLSEDYDSSRHMIGLVIGGILVCVGLYLFFKRRKPIHLD